MNEWKAPGKKTIVKCAVNQRQVVIALTGGELVYFEMDPVCMLALFPYQSSFDRIDCSPCENICSQGCKRCEKYIALHLTVINYEIVENR